MQIQIAKQKFKVTPRLKEHVEQRLRHALGRFADRIGAVTVKFTTGRLNGSVQDRRCRVEVGLDKPISVEAADADVFTAVNRAAEQATRSVTRCLDHSSASSGTARTRHVASKS